MSYVQNEDSGHYGADEDLKTVRNLLIFSLFGKSISIIDSYRSCCCVDQVLCQKLNLNGGFLCDDATTVSSDSLRHFLIEFFFSQTVLKTS